MARSASSRVTVEGEVETRDTHGIVRGTVERFPPSLYLRETAADRAPTRRSPTSPRACRDAERRRRAQRSCTRCSSALHDDMAFDTDPTHAATTAAEAFALKRGVCQDLTHIFIAAARSLGIPARYVGGYFHRDDGVIEQDAGHAWAEAFVPDLGWVAFDPANGICAHRRPCAGRGRARLSRRRAGARHPLRRRRRDAGGQGAGRPGAAADAELKRALPSLPCRRYNDCDGTAPIARHRSDHDLLLRNSRPRRPRDVRRHPHQCGRRQHLDLPQAARLHAAGRAHHGDRLGRQSVDQPVGRQHAARGLGESRDRRDARR